MARPLTLALFALSVAVACKPLPADLDAGCVPAPTTSPQPDAGAPTCQPWDAGCDSDGTAALQLALQNQFSTAGTCQADTDCALYGSLSYSCYEQGFAPPINAGKRPTLDSAIDGLLCGYCNACYSDGGVTYNDVTPVAADAGCVEVQCVAGQCQQITL